MKIHRILFVLFSCLFGGHLSCSQPVDKKVVGEAAQQSEQQSEEASQSAARPTQTPCSTEPAEQRLAGIIPFSKQDIEEIELCARAFDTMNSLEVSTFAPNIKDPKTALTNCVLNDMSWNAMINYIDRLKKHNITLAMLFDPACNALIKKQLPPTASALMDCIKKFNQDELLQKQQALEQSPIRADRELQQLIDALKADDISKVIEYAAKAQDINAKDSFDFTPLHYAAIVGNSEIIQHLLQRGARSVHNNCGMLPCLLYRGSDAAVTTALIPSDTFSALDNAIFTAYGDKSLVIAALLDYGADPFIVFGKKTVYQFFPELLREHQQNELLCKHLQRAKVMLLLAQEKEALSLIKSSISTSPAYFLEQQDQIEREKEAQRKAYMQKRKELRLEIEKRAQKLAKMKAQEELDKQRSIQRAKEEKEAQRKADKKKRKELRLLAEEETRKKQEEAEEQAQKERIAKEKAQKEAEEAAKEKRLIAQADTFAQSRAKKQVISVMKSAVKKTQEKDAHNNEKADAFARRTLQKKVLKKLRSHVAHNKEREQIAADCANIRLNKLARKTFSTWYAHMRSKKAMPLAPRIKAILIKLIEEGTSIDEATQKVVALCKKLSASKEDQAQAEQRLAKPMHYNDQDITQIEFLAQVLKAQSDTTTIAHARLEALFRFITATNDVYLGIKRMYPPVATMLRQLVYDMHQDVTLDTLKKHVDEYTIEAKKRITQWIYDDLLEKARLHEKEQRDCVIDPALEEHIKEKIVTLKLPIAPNLEKIFNQELRPILIENSIKQALGMTTRTEQEQSKAADAMHQTIALKKALGIPAAATHAQPEPTTQNAMRQSAAREAHSTAALGTDARKALVRLQPLHTDSQKAHGDRKSALDEGLITHLKPIDFAALFPHTAIPKGVAWADAREIINWKTDSEKK